MIYLDNAATSCPKPPAVVEAVRRTLTEVCANPGRGAYDDALEAGRILLRTRRSVARLCNIRDEARVVFTLNATHALNLALKGILGTGGNVVTSSLEHNSVVRPLAALAARGVTVTRVGCTADGSTDPDDILAALRPDTRLVVLTSASNVLGTLLPVAEVGPTLRERGVPLLVDAAQTAGSRPLDVEAMCVDLLALPGHKGLLGPQGVGVLYVGPGFRLETLMEGGAGSDSISVDPPEDLPDRYEAGTPNTPGIAGLGVGVDLVMKRGVEDVGKHEDRLTELLRAGFDDTEGITVYGPPAGVSRAPVVSVRFAGLPAAEAAFVFDRAFGIAVRAGLHCAPEAHRIAGTLEEGLVRFSIGHANTQADIDAAIEAGREVAAKAGMRS
ncbi:MAG TPA: aminotransferase class V-fold PLP-dependent enzyme [Thermoleophilia bacterium]|nr:aminotransferase class V-fold PLP-dependent enzyme [Thermoleophilia bacterium]